MSFKKKATIFDVVMRYMTEAFLYVKGKSNIMLKWTYDIVLDMLKKTQSQTFYYIHIIEIPTNKGANS